MIRCGKCHNSHSTVQEVRNCYAEVAHQEPAFSATGGQLNFIKDLLEARDFSGATPEQMQIVNETTQAIATGHVGQGYSKAASQRIDFLKCFPRKSQTQREVANAAGQPAPTAAVIDQDGIYRNPSNGEMWMVKWNRATGNGKRLYASRIVTLAEAVVDERGTVVSKGKRRFDYVPGAISQIRSEWRLSLDQAREFGALYGMCVYGHLLTKPESIRKGIGPICEEKYGWPAGRQQHAA